MPESHDEAGSNPRPPATSDQHEIAGRHVLFFSWRDTRNPEGGGAERYLEKIAEGLAHRGAKVTVVSAAHAGAPPRETVRGVEYVRRGGKLSIYALAARDLLRHTYGHVDLVVDVQNGLPFFTRLATRTPVLVLVHHVHEEQWPVVYPGLSGKVGWFIERRIAPRLYARCQYVAVSRATRQELITLGVGADRIAVVHNGTDPVLPVGHGKSAHPMVAVVGRLVPHKQVEHAIDATVALRDRFPGLRLHVVGSGWWESELHAHADSVGAGDSVVFEGQVDERRKHEVYERSWVLALPSLKEGWGLVIGEAGMHATPAVAYRSAGGTQESIAHDRSGVLVDTPAEFTDALATLLGDEVERQRLGAGAVEMSHTFTWEHAQESFAHVAASVLTGRVIAEQDPDEV